MAELNERDTKLVQYLTEAYGKEKELETALEAHIGMTSRAPYKKRLQQHLKETKSHAREVERRIKKLGGSVDGLTNTATTAAKKAVTLSKGPLHMLRGTSEPEKELKNAKTEFSEEAEEIATYTAIEALAEAVGDKDTAKLARTIRREEERMANYLEKLIPQLTKAVATAEIPASQRSTGRRRSTSSRRRTTSSGSSSSRSTSSRSGSSRSGSSRSAASRSGSSRSTSGRSGSSRSTSGRSGSSRSSGSRRSTSSRNGSSASSSGSRSRSTARARS
jgi:ferritin-like metal-binding protein YciE